MTPYPDLRLAATCRCRECGGFDEVVPDTWVSPFAGECRQCHGIGREIVVLTLDELRELLTPGVPAGEKT